MKKASYKISQFVSLFLALCIVFSVPCFASDNSNQGSYSGNKTVQVIGSDENAKIIFSITPQDLGIEESVASIGYINVSLDGSNSVMTGSMWKIGDVKKHSLKIELLYGTNSNPTTSANSTTTSNVGPIANPTKVTTNISSSKFWKVRVTGFMLDNQKVDYSTYVFLYNKKAVRYPDYTDSFSGRVMDVPSSSTWTKVGNPVSWTTTDRNNYIKWYEKTYNNGNAMSWNWADYQIHHIKPRAYGGTNDNSNLIPIKTPYHQQTVTPWWAQY